MKSQEGPVAIRISTTNEPDLFYSSPTVSFHTITFVQLAFAPDTEPDTGLEEHMTNFEHPALATYCSQFFLPFSEAHDYICFQLLPGIA